jgi:hypothetical protein
VVALPLEEIVRLRAAGHPVETSLPFAHTGGRLVVRFQITRAGRREGSGVADAPMAASGAAPRVWLDRLDVARD